MTRSSKLPKKATSATGRNKIVPAGPSEAGPTPVLVGGGVAARLGVGVGVDVAMGVGVGVAPAASTWSVAVARMVPPTVSVPVTMWSPTTVAVHKAPLQEPPPSMVKVIVEVASQELPSAAKPVAV